MHSRVYGIYVLNNLEEILTDITPLNENSYDYECIIQFADYVKEIDMETEGRTEFEDHLTRWFPNTSSIIINHTKAYKITQKDLLNILDKEYQYFKTEVIAFNRNDFFDIASAARNRLVESLQGEYGGIKYGILINEDSGFDYPENFLQTIRYLYKQTVKHKKQEIFVQFLGSLDYHY